MLRRLETLTNAELAQLKVRLGGKPVLVIVHPFYDGQGKSFQEFVAGSKAHNKIIIIGEEHQQRQATETELEKACSHNKATLLTYSTKTTCGTPIMGWQKLLRRLELMGVKRVVLGGNHIKEESVNTPIFWKSILLGIEKNRKLNKKEREKLSTQRMLLRAAKARKAEHVLRYCAGFTASKLAASGKFKVKMTRHFSR